MDRLNNLNSEFKLKKKRKIEANFNVVFVTQSNDREKISSMIDFLSLMKTAEKHLTFK